LSDVAGVEELGATGRGENMEIGTYIERALTSELSANIVDLCPVGALTAKPYAYIARPWELAKTESVDVTDALGSNIRVDSRGGRVLRILPRLNEDVNEEWLTDKARFSLDGLARRRLDRPFVRVAGQLQEASWQDAFNAIAARLSRMPGAEIAAIAGDLADAEAMCALKDLMGALGSGNIDCRQDGAALDPACRAGYIFNSAIAGIEQADRVLLIGANPRMEAAVLNARLRKRWLQGGFRVASIGPALDLTFPVTTLGAGPATLAELAAGAHEWFGILKSAKRPMLILGQGALRRPDGAAILDLARTLADAADLVREDWNGFNVLHTVASRVGGLDLGFVPGVGGRDVASIVEGCESGTLGALYLLGADEIDMGRLGHAFVIYQGHHGDRGARRADVVLPGAAYTEKDATYVNTEGRVQHANRAVFPPGDAREDWRILRALSGVLGKPLPYDSLAALRARMTQANPVFAHPDTVERASWGAFGKKGSLDRAPFACPTADYYRTDAIGRASPTMKECAETLGVRKGEPRTGTHG
jgi:NADH-quinone oxidoreductase subunit G